MDAKSKQILSHWFTRSRIAQKTHLRTAERKLRRNKQLGIPVVILTTTVGTSVFASLTITSPNAWAQILVGLTSICAAVLASLQTFLNFSDKSDQHRLAANRYSKIKHDIEISILELDNAPDDEIAAFVKQVQVKWDATNENSPIPDQDIFNTVFKELGGDIHFDYILKDHDHQTIASK